jgi:hypothetical protein
MADLERSRQLVRQLGEALDRRAPDDVGATVAPDGHSTDGPVPGDGHPASGWVERA